MLNQLGRVILTVMVAGTFAMLAANTAQAAKGGNGGGKPGGEDPLPVIGCSGDFPALAFLEVRRQKNGRILGTDLVLTNATADCRIVVYSSDNIDDLSFTNDDGVYRLAWRRLELGSSNVQVADFTLSDPDDDGVVSINELLPLQPKEVFRYQGPYSYGGVHGVDIQRNQLVFGYEENGFADGNFYTIYHIDNLDSCLVQAEVAPVGEACVESIATATDNDPLDGNVNAILPMISDDGMGVYYETESLAGISEFDREIVQHLSFVQGGAGNWSMPQRVLTDIDLGPSSSSGVYGAVRLPRFGMLNGQPTLAYRLRDLNPDIISIRFVALVGPNGPCEPVSGSESCFALGTAESIEDLWLPNADYLAQFRWSSSQLLILRSGSIAAWDPATNSESTLLTSGNIVKFDPVD
jgi:hypothetical protein